MSRRLSLIVAAVALVVLGGAYAFITLAKPFEKKPEAVAPSAPLPDPLISVDEATVTRVSYAASDGGILIFERSGESFALVQPKIVDPRLLDDEVKRLFQAMARVAPEEKVYDPADGASVNLADYGLDAPRALSAAYQDGSRFDLEIGGTSPSGRLYARKKGDAVIWALPSWTFSIFNEPLASLRDKTLPTVDPQDIQEFAVSGTGSPAPIRLAHVEGDGDGFFMSPHRLLTPFKRPQPVDSDFFGKIAEKITPLSISSFIDEGGPLSAYGLDKPYLDIRLADSQTSFRLLVGKSANADGSERYAKLASEPRVFTIAASGVSFAEGIEPFRLVGKLPMLVPIDSVDAITVIAADGKKRELSITRGPVPTEKDAEREENFFANGVKVETDKFKQAYQAVIGIALEGELPAEFVRAAAAAPKPELEVVFKRNEGKSDLRYRFYRASRDFLAFEWTGEREFAVSAVQAANNLARMDSLLGL